MRFEISERVTTKQPASVLLQALEAQFRKASAKLDAGDGQFKASMLAASFGSINRKDDTVVRVKPVDGGQLFIADVWYRPSLAFWVLLLVGLFSAVGWLLPIGFYLYQKKTVTQAIRACFERVNNEFAQVGGVAAAVAAESFESALDKLGALKERGLINDDDFSQRKQALIKLSAAEPTDAPTRADGVMRPPFAGDLVRPANSFDVTQGLSSDAGVAMSHQGDDLPPGIKGWSWGAFFMNFIWAISNRTWIGLLALVPVIGLPIPFLLGMKGREWAWRNRKWDSLDHFQRVQRQWSKWGAIFYVLVFTLAAADAVYEKHQEQADAANQAAIEVMNRYGTNAAVAKPPDPEAPPATEVSVAPESPRPVQGRIFEKEIDPLFIVGTVAGTVGLSEDAEKNQHIILDGKQLFHGDDAPYQHPIKLFHLAPDQDALLVESSGGRGTSCESLFFFLILNKSGAVTWTPEFGSCVRDGSYEQSGNQVELTIPKVGGVTHYVFSNGQVTADGTPVAFYQDHGNDPAN